MFSKILVFFQQFVKKHNLKTSSIEKIAQHIRLTIEKFKNSNSNISMQSPSLDDHDNSEERTEYDKVAQQQQNQRDSSIQKSLHPEPLDLPTELDNNHFVKVGPSAERSAVNYEYMPEPSPSLLSKSASFRSHDTSIVSATADVSPEEERQRQLELTGEDQTLCTKSYDVVRVESGDENSKFPPTMKDLNISPIKRHTIGGLFPTVNAEFLDMENSKDFGADTDPQENKIVESLQPFSKSVPSHHGGTSPSPSSEHQSLIFNEKNHASSNNTKESSSIISHTTRDEMGHISTPASTARKAISKTSSFSNSSTKNKVGDRSGADVYNKLKSEWSGNVGRRKSIVTCKEPSPKQLSAIGDIKQRSTLVVSKSIGGTLYGSSVRQPSSGDSDSDSLTNTTLNRNRLYEDAMAKSKRLETLRMKAIKEEKDRLAEQAYSLPKSSRKMNSNLKRKDAHLPIGERLHKEAGAISKKKCEKSKLWAEKKESTLKDWSCLQCGTYNYVKIPRLDAPTDQSTTVFVCKSCDTSYDLETLEQSMFHPTNVAAMNGTMGEAATYRRAIGGESIHDYLHANIELETKKLQLLKESWEDEDEILTFKPIIPESSKQILRRYQKMNKSDKYTTRKNGTNDENDNQASNIDVRDGKGKIVVAESGLESYLTLPPTERLSKAETLCRVSSPGSKKRKNREQDENKSSSPLKTRQLSETKMDNLFSRLTYEYIERESKRDLARRNMEKADSTGRAYFKPTIGAVPATVYNSAPVFASEKKETIYEKLLRKGAEAKERAKLLRAKVLKKEKDAIEKEFCQPLLKSESILKESSDQCIEEIFKLLIANQLFFQKKVLPNGESSKDVGMTNQRIKLTAEYLNDVSEKLDKFEDLLLDVRTIDPNLVVEDVQDLLKDLRALGLRNATKLRDKNNENGNSSDTESCFFISFNQFKSMIKKCTAQRAGGVGKSYIYVPKPRDTTVKELLAEESKECTFHPTITSKSRELAKNRGRGETSIEVILKDEAFLKEQRLQYMTSLIESDRTKDCTFKPTLYRPPKTVIPRYGGESRECFPEKSQSIEGGDDDEISVITASTCSTTVRPTFSNDSHDKDIDISNRVPVMKHQRGKKGFTVPISSSLENNENGAHSDVSDGMPDAEEVKQNISGDITLRWARHNDIGK